MRARFHVAAWLTAGTFLTSAITGCTRSQTGSNQRVLQRGGGGGSNQDWPTGHYRVVEDWPKPLPDTRHSHDGWTWGSFGGVYAESPDRIWIAMRGELPLPARRQAVDAVRGAEAVARQRHRQRRRHLSATCEPEAKRGWERRFEHSIFIVDGQGNLVDEWPHLDEMFSQLPCGRGPHRSRSARTTRRSTSGSSTTSCT